jgi:hypothetical protein
MSKLDGYLNQLVSALIADVLSGRSDQICKGVIQRVGQMLQSIVQHSAVHGT